MRYLITFIVSCATICPFHAGDASEINEGVELNDSVRYNLILNGLNQIIFYRNTDSLLTHIDPAVQFLDDVRSKNDLDSVWRISELREKSEIWDYLETRVLAEKLRKACFDTVHYSYLQIKPFVIPCCEQSNYGSLINEDYYTVRICDIYSDQNLQARIGVIAQGQRVKTNWEEFQLNMNSRQDVIPIKELGVKGISGWVRDRDVFDFNSGSNLLINFNNGNWVISGL